jgi:hypothetical protein
MGILKNADDSPTFTTGDPLSPTALNILRDSLLALDEATRLGGYAFLGLYGQHPEENAVQQWVIWRGGFVFLTGMTTLRIVTSTTGTISGGTVLRVYRGDNGANDALPATYNDLTLSSGTQTHTITISGSGYTNQQIVRVQMELRHGTAPTNPYAAAKVDVVLAEVTPISLASWPAAPSFASAADVNASKLNQLSAAVDWLIERASLRYDPLFILHLRRNGPFRNELGETDVNNQWYGGIRRTPLHTTIVARGRVLILTAGMTETVKLYVNGSLAATYNVASTVGEFAWELTASVSGIADATVIPIRIEYARSAPNQLDPPRQNKWTINEVFAQTPTGGAATLAEWQVRQAAVADSTIVSWLASCSTLATACYDRIAANDGFWEHQRLFTARPASGNDNFRLFEPWGIPATWRRVGEAIVARGRGLTIGYGAGYFDEAAFAKESAGSGGIGAYPVKNTKTFTLIDGDNVESGRLYLDTVPGLPAGSAFNVRGEESYYLGEQLKVVE